MSDPRFPKNKAELMSSIEREWTALQEVVKKLNDQQMNSPDADGWSPKDHLAHLTEWIKSFAGYHLDRRAWHEVLGVNRQITDAFDFDGINAVLYERNRNKSAKDVLAGLQNAYRDVKSKLDAISFDDLMKPRFNTDPEKRPVMNWVLSNTTEHFAEHREYIERILKANS